MDSCNFLLFTRRQIKYFGNVVWNWFQYFQKSELFCRGFFVVQNHFASRIALPFPFVTLLIVLFLSYSPHFGIAFLICILLASLQQTANKNQTWISKPVLAPFSFLFALSMYFRCVGNPSIGVSNEMDSGRILKNLLINWASNRRRARPGGHLIKCRTVLLSFSTVYQPYASVMSINTVRSWKVSSWRVTSIVFVRNMEWLWNDDMVLLLFNPLYKYRVIYLSSSRRPHFGEIPWDY